MEREGVVRLDAGRRAAAFLLSCIEFTAQVA